MPFYREDLEARAGCSACEAEGRAHVGETFFHAVCHPDAPTWVSYWGDLLTLHCSACRKVVASFVVASREHEGLDDPSGGARAG